MKLLLLFALIKHAYFERGFVKDVYMNKKFQCSTSVKETFTVNSEIQCSHRCLRKSCTRIDYNAKQGEIGNCEVFIEVGGCSGLSDQSDWKALVFEVNAIRIFSMTQVLSSRYIYILCQTVFLVLRR